MIMKYDSTQAVVTIFSTNKIYNTLGSWYYLFQLFMIPRGDSQI